jgi:hypothetical protein
MQALNKMLSTQDSESSSVNIAADVAAPAGA